jgi:bla regulator protein blaR1
MTAELLRILALSTVASCAALVLVLASRTSMRHWFGARVAYALWAFVPLAGVIALLPAPVAQIANSSVIVSTTPDTFEAAPIAVIIAPSFDPTSLLLVLWLAGVALVAFLFARQQRHFVRMLGRLSNVGSDVVRAETTAGCPALIGALRPRVVVPWDFEQRYSQTERDLILAHERTHRGNGDAQINLLAAAVRCVFWFNPLFHFAASRFRFDQELACDASVISRFPEARRSYADAMLKTQLADFGLPVGCHWQSSHPLKERIAMLKQPLPGLARRALGAGIAAALVFGGAYAAWATQPAQLATDTSVAGDAISAELVLNVDGKPLDGWNSHTDHMQSMHHGAADPSKWDLRVTPGQPFTVAINKGDESWELDATAKPLSGNTLEWTGRLRHNGGVVGNPRLAMREGEPAGIKIGEQVGDQYKGFGAQITLARADANPVHQATPAPGAVTFRSMKRIAYPAAALAAKVQGVVYVKAHIGKDGTVVTAVADRIDPTSAGTLSDAAINGLKTWTFNPAQKDGKPVASDEIIPVVFSLSSDNVPRTSGGTLDAIRVSPPAAEPVAATMDSAPSEDAQYRKMFPPTYPAAALDAKKTAKIQVKVLIDEHGTPQSAQIYASDPPEAEQYFAQASIDAVMQWRFNPGVKNGKPEGGYSLIPITYSLTKD